MPDDTILMERAKGGLTVQLLYVSPEIVIRAATEDDSRFAVIPPDKAIDAFLHPMVYLEDTLVFA